MPSKAFVKQHCRTVNGRERLASLVAELQVRGKKFAPGEDRTHDLQIMRLTRCLLRYGSRQAKSKVKRSQTRVDEYVLEQGLIVHVGREVNREAAS